ncbi:DNA binding protein [Stemphylium lycopersici]|uniref:DNA binding protein n=1 Tax=Stemphylium lycopersici TaxID=183478 RepID=A0A364N4N1_STELY|nr:hypothetical protein TW65_08781 [Stemphylium lycopersici]RAR11838.1 DNA binding protein [Stemphylium lycopersici]RAR12010.1 DNA binding protein [Stemphylium lycopersici]
MPPKKDTAGGESSELLAGFSDKETKLLAAAFLSSTAPDKTHTDQFNYDVMATLTRNTAGSLKKMWPPIKKKAIENHPSFAKFLGQAGAAAPAGEPKPAVAPKGRKRKASDEGTEDSAEAVNEKYEPASAANKSDDDKSDSKKQKKPVAEKKAPAAKGRGRPKKQAKKKEEAIKSEENSADGSDSLGADLEDDAT